MQVINLGYISTKSKIIDEKVHPIVTATSSNWILKSLFIQLPFCNICG